VRVGLIGFGLAGRHFHAPLLDEAGLRLTHVVTGDAGRAAQARSAVPGVTVVATVEDLWSSAEALDLVVVASATAAHAGHALAAIDRGLPVVVDKPLSLDAASARAVVQAAEQQRVPLTVFQNRRWDAEHLTTRAVLERGVLGDVVRYEARFERWRPVPKTRWRETLPGAEGGGLLLDLQSHLVDGALQLFGPATSVYAEVAAVTTVGDDVTFLALRHRSGVVSHLGATSLAGLPGPRARVLGREGAYVVGPVLGEGSSYAGWADAAEDHLGWVVRGDDVQPVARLPRRWADFYRGVAAMLRDGSPAPVDPWDAVAVLEVLDAARVSARDRVVVAV